MKKTSLAIFVSMLSLAATGYAQAPSTEIRESTDPAKAAEVEQRAADIQARQQAAEQNMSSGDSGTTKRDAKRSKAKKGMSRSAKPKSGESSSGSSGAGGASDSSPSGQDAGSTSK